MGERKKGEREKSIRERKHKLQCSYREDGKLSRNWQTKRATYSRCTIEGGLQEAEISSSEHLFRIVIVH